MGTELKNSVRIHIWSELIDGVRGVFASYFIGFNILGEVYGLVCLQREQKHSKLVVLQGKRYRLLLILIIDLGQFSKALLSFSFMNRLLKFEVLCLCAILP